MIPQYSFQWDSGKVTYKDVPKTVVQQKFELFDSFVEATLISLGVAANNLTKCEPEELGKVFDDFFREYMPRLNEDAKAMLGQLLMDDTIMAYAFLRYQNVPIKLRYYQDAIISDPNRFIDVEGANQQGKSFLLCTTAVCDLIRDHGKNWTVVLVSRSRELNANNMLMIKQMLTSTAINFENESDSMSVVVRKTDTGFYNRIVCAVAGEGGLAYAANRVLMDEFEFWKEEGKYTLEYYHDQIFLQRTNETKGQLIIYSNPNGKNFISENLHKRVYTNGPNKGKRWYHVYNFDFLANPSNTVEEFEDRKKWMNPIIFSSTMAALRTEAEGAALSDQQILDSYDELLNDMGEKAGIDKQCYFFLDLGFVHDQSMLTGMYVERDAPNQKPTYKLFYQLFYPIGYDHSKIWGKIPGEYPSIKDVLKKYEYKGMQPVFGMDLTGKEGNEIHATDVGVSVIPVKMSGPWKATWYERFCALVAQRRFKRGNVDNWRDGKNKNWEGQARTLQISTKMPDGRNRQYAIYHHQTEADLDDAIDSSVGCLSLIDEEMEGSPSATFIESKKESNDTDWAEVRRLQKSMQFGLSYG